MREELTIRVATGADAPALLKIYSYYVQNTAITFEYEVPSTEEFERRIVHTLERYPYLVAEDQGQIVGYAYAGPFKTRAAYAWNVELSIYVEKGQKRRGIGRALYTTLEQLLKEQGVLNLNACIAYPVTEDKYLTRDSVRFHEKQGYTLVGEFHQSGYKFKRWYNMIWMEKLIGEHTENQPPVKPFEPTGTLTL